MNFPSTFMGHFVLLLQLAFLAILLFDTGMKKKKNPSSQDIWTTRSLRAGFFLIVSLIAAEYLGNRKNKLGDNLSGDV